MEFGSIWYIKHDPDQFPHQLVAVVLQPGNVFKFRLSYLGDVSELYDFECSQEPNTDFTKDE